MVDSDAWFRQALALEDEVERAHALCDLAFDADMLLQQGQHADAAQLFALLYSLNPDDDLLFPAWKTARAGLIQLGKIVLPPLEQVANTLLHTFAALPLRARYLAVAKTLCREYRQDYPDAPACAWRLLQAAHQLQPLYGKDARLQKEIAAAQPMQRDSLMPGPTPSIPNNP